MHPKFSEKAIRYFQNPFYKMPIFQGVSAFFALKKQRLYQQIFLANFGQNTVKKPGLGMNILLPLFRACHSTAGRLEYVLNQLEKSVKYGSKQVGFCYISSTFYELFNAFLIRSGTSYVQVLVLTPGVRVQVPPRAPKAPISKEIGAFFCLYVRKSENLKK